MTVTTTTRIANTESYFTDSTSLSKQNGHVMYTTNSSQNIIFEFVPFDISTNYTVIPTFEGITDVGLTNVSAITEIDVAASSLNKLFYFESFTDVDNTIVPVKYGINTDYKFNLAYSNSNMMQGSINTNAKVLSADYVNYLAYAITGGYSTADIFHNETELINGVTTLDASFNDTINYNISNCSNYPNDLVVDSSMTIVDLSLIHI